MTEIFWSRLAIDDLKSIEDYISKDSKVYAQAFVQKLISRVEQLEHSPQSGRIVPECDDQNIRELIEGNYRIIYTLNQGSATIVRIHHAARQLRQLP